MLSHGREASTTEAKDNQKNHKSWYKKPGCISDFLFLWFTPIAFKGWRQDLNKDDFGVMRPELNARRQTLALERLWYAQEQSNHLKGHKNGGDFALLRAVGSRSFRSFAHALVYLVLAEVCIQIFVQISESFLILIESNEGSGPISIKTIVSGCFLCTSMFVIYIGHAIFISRSYWITHLNGMRTKIGLSGLIFQKMLKLAPETRKEYSLGRTVALMSTSVARIEAAFPYLHYIWFGPLQIILLLTMLWLHLGWNAMRWIILLIALAMPIQIIIMQYMNLARRRIAMLTDRRLRFLQETIMGIRVVKCYAWEPIFQERLLEYRSEEIRAIFRWRLLGSLAILLNVGVPAFSAVIGFVLSSYETQKIDGSVIWPSLIYFNLLDLPLSNMPTMTNLSVDAFAALNRIQDFLRTPSISPHQIFNPGASHAILIENGFFNWVSLDQNETEENVSGQVKKNTTLDTSTDTANQILKSSNFNNSEQNKEFKNSNLDSSQNLQCEESKFDVESSKVVDTAVVESGVEVEGKRSDTKNGVVENSNILEEVMSLTSIDEVLSISSIGDQDDFSQMLVFDSVVQTWPSIQPVILEAPMQPLPEIQLHQILDDEFESESNDSGLSSISLTIPHGSLVAIIGPVSSGKSSLLAAIHGEMALLSGRIVIGGTVGYCPQQPWIINASIRENIILGQEFIPSKYWRIIKDCQMESDLVALPFGDLTDIGEGGISLSGGQKARLNLARMVYFDRDICLMDDPLAAVDSKVGRAIMQNLILGDSLDLKNNKDWSHKESKSFLANKTRIIVTHNLTVIPHCDLIIVMKDGSIADFGTYNDLISNPGPLAEMIASQERADKFGQDGDSDNINQEFLSAKNLKVTENALDSLEDEPNIVDLKSPLVHQMTSTNEDVQKVSWRNEELQAKPVNRKIYGVYIYACGALVFVAFVVLTMVWNEILRTGRDIWIEWWVTVEDGFGLGMTFVQLRNWYIVLAVFQTMATWLCGIVFFIGSYRASRRLHDRALARVLASPLRFFESTPVGRIINRFGRDMDLIDVQISDDLWYLLFAFGSMTSTLLVMFIKVPWSILVVIFPVSMAILLQAIYKASARQLHRIYASFFSPLMANFSETYLGLPIIRAFRHETHFSNRHYEAMNNATICSYNSFALRRWTAMYCEFICAVLIFLASMSCFIMRVPASITGLVTSPLVNFVFSLDWFIKQVAELETSMVAVERMHQYATELQTEHETFNQKKLLCGIADKDEFVLDLETEKNFDLALDSSKTELSLVDHRNLSYVDLSSKDTENLLTNQQLDGWPSSGVVIFRNVSLTYRTGARPVLSNLSFSLQAGERLGIVGRTGAGKSSIMAALTRTVELSEGSIWIDSFCISQIPLPILRSRVTIVPQEPVLFAGTIAFNLDPRGEKTDEELWNVLARVGMRRFVSRLRKKLQYQVYDFGENFSLGHRQLLCLARALLCHSKIVLMDEATASMDTETDLMVQKSLRENFVGCTIITIAHRLGTIRDYDRVLVLDGGCVVECDAPSRLLADPKSHLSSLFRSSMRNSH